jgi:uncharacterized protein (DUF1800 family)
MSIAAIAKKKRAKKHTSAVAAGTRKHRLHVPPAAGTTSTEVTLTSMSPAMVERLFWRAGFGPSAEDRATWAGKPVGDAVNALLTGPADLVGPAPTRDGKTLDPTGDDTDLVLAWLDRMVRSRNALTERLTFFWHRHWANSRDSVSPPQLLVTQNNLFRSYANFAATPAASFKDMAYAVTEDPSMLRYLTGESNVRGAPNENYGREVMELFGLGVLNAAGAPNYTENDVKQIAKAFSGWQINDSNPDAASSYFTPSRWYNGPKIVFGRFGNYKARDAVDLVLSHPAHARYIILKIWSEFIVTPPDDATLNKLTSSYTSSGYQLKPLLEQILSHPLLFESLAEPNMLKPPIVYVVGSMRALGVGVTDDSPTQHLDAMGQVPYFPPTVAGWEGGLSWLNTNTALARFGFVGELLNKATIADVLGETAAAAYDRAYAAVGSPWLAAGTQSAIRDYASRAGASSPKLRKERQLMLRALMLAGPDAQVM